MPHQSPNLDLSDMSDLLEHDLLILTRPGEMGLILPEPNVVCSFYSPVRIANMALHILLQAICINMRLIEAPQSNSAPPLPVTSFIPL